MENLDETHFTINVDNGQILSFQGDTFVEYVDVVVGRGAMNIVVQIFGGRRSSLKAPMIIPSVD